MCGGGSKAKALQACLLLRDGMVLAKVSDQKKIVYLRKQVELNQVVYNTIKGKTCVSFRPEYGHNGFA